MDPGTGDPVWHSGMPAAQIAVIAALELEAAILRRAYGAHGPNIYVSGPGLERARATALRAVTAGARALMGWGLAGGLSHEAVNGSVILPARLLDGSGSWPTDAAWREQLSAMLVPAFRPLQLPLYSVESAVTTPAGKVALAAASGAAAVDMESAAIARVAAEAGLPCLILRVVTDGPDATLPAEVESLVTETGHTRLSGLFRMLLAPAQLAALIRLARQSQHARKVLQQLAAMLAEHHS